MIRYLSQKLKNNLLFQVTQSNVTNIRFQCLLGLTVVARLAMALINPPLDSQYTKGRFTDKVCIITGGASGIGRAAVYRFVNDGAAVAVFDMNESAGKQLQADLTTAGYNVKFYQVDVSVKEQCVEAVKKVGEEHEGKIDFLVNNAGIPVNNAGIAAPCKGEPRVRRYYVYIWVMVCCSDSCFKIHFNQPSSIQRIETRGCNSIIESNHVHIVTSSLLKN